MWWWWVIFVDVVWIFLPTNVVIVWVVVGGHTVDFFWIFVPQAHLLTSVWIFVPNNVVVGGGGGG